MEINKIIKRIEELPLCYDDGITENDNDMEFIRGQAHIKEHIIKLIKKLKNEKY